ncbi:MAG TPA: TlpA disulfide reductase family protein [Casimicrobiaceae bacterium]|jgi:thiol-disulfide isomerase/thioredoxin
MNMNRWLIVGLCAACLAPMAARAVDVGAPAPAFALPDASAKAVSLAAFKGRVVYVDFWASWCGPCRKSFPWMNAMQQKYGAQGFTVIAVNVDKRRGDAERFLAQVPARFTTVFDASGATPTAYDVKAMPSSVLIDAAGNVTLVEEGFRDERRDALEASIRALLAHS